MMDPNINTVTIKIGKGVEYFNLPKEARIKLYKDLTFDNPKYLSAKRHGSFIGADTKPYIYFFNESQDRKILWTPRGYIWYMKRWLKHNKYEVKIEDRTLVLPKIDIEFKGQLRDYQKKAAEEMVRRYPIGVLEASTGAGKTVTATGIIAMRKQPTLIIVHNKELLYQWQGAIKKFLDYDCGLLGDGKCDIKDITVGIINTVKNKMDDLKYRFGHIILDECFPAGTLIDGKPIEDIRIGDYVNSFNHTTNKVEKKKVINLFKKKPVEMCIVKLKNGKKIICTPNHPFYTTKGYLTASCLYDTSVLIIDTKLKSKHDEVMNENCNMSKMQQRKSSERGLSKEASEESMLRLSNKKYSCTSRMCSLWKDCGMFREKTHENISYSSKNEQCEMFGNLCTETNCTRQKKRWGISEKIQSSICWGKNEKKQSDAYEGCKGESDCIKKNKWNFKYMEGRKRRERKSNFTARKDSSCFRMGDGSCCENSRSRTKKFKDGMVSKKESSYDLQSGCRKREIEDSNRDRWEESQLKGEKETRQEERISFKMERVESVEIYKSTSGQGFEKLCKDGYVYNIEVEDNNNYFAENILVHNCHRSPSSIWKEALSEFRARHYLGLSATPYRKDGLGRAIYVNIGPKIHTVDSEMLQESGAVLKPQIILVKTDFRFGRSWSDEQTSSYATIIKALTTDETRNKLICRTIYNDLKQNRQNLLVVSDRVTHCKEIARMLKSINIKSHVLHGGVNKKERKQIVEDVKAGKCKVLIATLSLIGEGFDAPNLSGLFLTTPIKFGGRLIQTVGRILRPEKDKIPRVYDFRDENVIVLRNSGFSRNAIYKKQWR